MKKYKLILVILNLFILFGYFYFAVSRKEKILKSDNLILLELAPVDPRSLMQGDYMVLNYDISSGVSPDSVDKRGYCVIRVDTSGVARRIRFQKNKLPLTEGEHLIEYTSSGRWNLNIGAESFFFQEGHGNKYEQAKYGGLKVDKEGNSLLVGLYDENLTKIE